MPHVVVDPPPGSPLQTVSVEESVHRSTRRLFALALGTNTDSGNPWQVVLEERAVPIDKRPAAVVAMVAPITAERSTRASIPQGAISRYASLVVTAYPEKGMTARDATLRATRVASLLADTIEVGLIDDDLGQTLSYPLHVPIFDYGLLDEDERDRRPAPGFVVQQAAIVDHSVQAIPDPQVDKLWTVVASLRLRYYRPGRIRAIGEQPPLADRMPGLFVP